MDRYSLPCAGLACSHTTSSKGQWLFWAQPGLRLPLEEGRPQWGNELCSGLPPDLVSGSRVVLAASTLGSEARPGGGLGLGLRCCPSRPQSRCGQPCSPTPRRTGLPHPSHSDHTHLPSGELTNETQEQKDAGPHGGPLPGSGGDKMQHLRDGKWTLPFPSLPPATP